MHAVSSKSVVTGEKRTTKKTVAKATTRKSAAKAAASRAEKATAKRTSATKPARKGTKVTFKARKTTKGDVALAKTGKVDQTAAKASSVGSIVTRYASAYGIPANLAHAVIKIESNYHPGARGSAGEIGLMQIKPATARGLGYSGSSKGLFDPDTNLRYGMMYLAKAHQLARGDTCGTILRYNAGHGAKRMNPVSAAYCSKVKRELGS